MAKSNHNYKQNIYLEGYVDNGDRPSRLVAPEGSIIPPPIIIPPAITPNSILVEQTLPTLDTFAVGDLISNNTFDNVPLPTGQVILTVNGVDLTPADGPSGVFTSAFYITDSTGSVVKPKGSYEVGDLFHWNGAAAGFELESAVDKLILIYEIAT